MELYDQSNIKFSTQLFLTVTAHETSMICTATFCIISLLHTGHLDYPLPSWESNLYEKFTHVIVLQEQNTMTVNPFYVIYSSFGRFRSLEILIKSGFCLPSTRGFDSGALIFIVNTGKTVCNSWFYKDVYHEYWCE